MVFSSVEVKPIFPTVLLRRRLDSVAPLNGRLREIVLEREARDPGIVASNVDGWHSEADLMEWDYPEIGVLTRAFIESGVKMTRASLPPGLDGDIDVRFHGGCWANVLRDGGYNKIHNHPGAVWSGCYYVSVGNPDPEPECNGCIEFQDPRPGNIYGGKEAIRPEAGLLLIFPGWLNHFVNPYKGTGERISIAFNLQVEVTPHRLCRASAAPSVRRQPERTLVEIC